MRWHRIWSPLLAAGVIVAATGIAWASYESYLGYRVVKVQVDGRPVEGPVPAILVDGSTMVPLRAVSEALGAKVSWDENSFTVSLDNGAAVATVNGQPVSKEALYQRLVEQSGQQVLKDLIIEELINQEANKAGVKITPEAVRAELAKLKQQLGSEENFQQALRQYGLTEAKVMRDLQAKLVARQVLAPRIDQAVTAEKVAEHYRQNESRLRWPELQVRARHILVKTEVEAQAALARLEKGESFESLAKELSIDTGSREKGGDLGFFGQGAMVQPFEQAAFSLGVGQRSGIVQTQFGFHIIAVTDRKEGTTRTSEEAMAAGREELAEDALRQLNGPWLKEIQAKANVTTNLK